MPHLWTQLRIQGRYGSVTNVCGRHCSFWTSQTASIGIRRVYPLLSLLCREVDGKIASATRGEINLLDIIVGVLEVHHIGVLAIRIDRGKVDALDWFLEVEIVWQTFAEIETTSETEGEGGKEKETGNDDHEGEEGPEFEGPAESETVER